MTQRDQLDSKLQNAIKALGKNWVLHPEYRQPEHHSLSRKSSHTLARIESEAKAAGRI